MVHQPGLSSALKHATYLSHHNEYYLMKVCSFVAFLDPCFACPYLNTLIFVSSPLVQVVYNVLKAATVSGHSHMVPTSACH